MCAVHTAERSHRFTPRSCNANASKCMHFEPPAHDAQQPPLQIRISVSRHSTPHRKGGHLAHKRAHLAPTCNNQKCCAPPSHSSAGVRLACCKRNAAAAQMPCLTTTSHCTHTSASRLCAPICACVLRATPLHASPSCAHHTRKAHAATGSTVRLPSALSRTSTRDCSRCVMSSRAFSSHP